MAELQLIIVFHSRHFLRHLGISSLIYVQLQQLISGIITHYFMKSEVSILTLRLLSAGGPDIIFL